MKKSIALMLILCLLAVAAVGCGNSASSTSNKAYNMTDIISKIEETAPVAMAGDVDDTYVQSVLGLSTDDYEEYAGKYSMANVNVDTLLIVKAKPGKTDTVKAALEKQRDNLAAMNEMYLQDQYEKAKNGLVIVKGDYVALVIVGDNDRFINGEAEAVYKELSAVVDEAFQ